MKNIIAVFITITLLTNCTPPEWKQKGFNSKAEYLKDQEKQKWLSLDSKFIGTWRYKEYITGSKEYTGKEVYLVYRIEIMEDGYGKFEETQGTRYQRNDDFRWKKIDGETIQISGLQGDLNPFEGTYNFAKFNDKYKLNFESNCFQLRNDYVFCQ